MKQLIRRIRRGYQHFGKRYLVRLSERDIVEALERLGAPPQHGLMVHSSLSACGQIVGGAAAVIRALRTWSSEAPLVLPTHTYCYQQNPTHEQAYDPRQTSSAVGAITNYFWRQSGTVRSLHPTHSLAAQGETSQALCAGHELCETPCGKGTPYHRLVMADASVLMLGTTLNTFTFFHTTEDLAAVPYLYEPETYNLGYLTTTGEVRSVVSLRQEMSIRRRFIEMDKWLEERGLLVRGRLGWGELLYMPHAAAVNEALLTAIRREPLLLVHPDSHKAALKMAA